MKKFGILIFIAAIILGIFVSSFFSIGPAAKPSFSFSFNKTTKGSGNVSTEARDIRDFTGVDVSGVFQVEITAQKDFAVEIEADDNLIPLIKTEVRGGVLHIETEDRLSTDNGLKVRIHAPDIDDIDASGAAKINATAISNEQLQVHTSGASKISLSGETANLSVDVSGASRIEAENLKAENAEVDASGASSVSVFAAGELRTDLSGASKVVYSGSPKNIYKKTSGASSVKEK
ncbi:MAG: DUF2807 domain-containing protein [Acidobacteria bacterium]|nr:DUF2807 domain-containing protein [Acidobacteriota bacterium]